MAENTPESPDEYQYSENGGDELFHEPSCEAFPRPPAPANKYLTKPNLVIICVLEDWFEHQILLSVDEFLSNTIGAVIKKSSSNNTVPRDLINDHFNLSKAEPRIDKLYGHIYIYTRLPERAPSSAAVNEYKRGCMELFNHLKTTAAALEGCTLTEIWRFDDVLSTCATNNTFLYLFIHGQITPGGKTLGFIKNTGEPKDYLLDSDRLLTHVHENNAHELIVISNMCGGKKFVIPPNTLPKFHYITFNTDDDTNKPGKERELLQLFFDSTLDLESDPPNTHINVKLMSPISAVNKYNLYKTPTRREDPCLYVISNNNYDFGPVFTITIQPPPRGGQRKTRRKRRIRGSRKLRHKRFF